MPARIFFHLLVEVESQFIVQFAFHRAPPEKCAHPIPQIAQHAYPPYTISST